MNNAQTESVEKLIKAVNDYEDRLSENMQTLMNAASLCEQAMGNDDVVKKKVARLQEALVLLSKTASLAESTAVALRNEKDKMEEYYDQA